MKKINDILKIILAIISTILIYIQFNNHNTVLIIYWFIVAIYWITNYLSGHTKK